MLSKIDALVALGITGLLERGINARIAPRYRVFIKPLFELERLEDWPRAWVIRFCPNWAWAPRWAPLYPGRPEILKRLRLGPVAFWRFDNA